MIHLITPSTSDAFPDWEPAASSPCVTFGVSDSFNGADPETGCCPVELETAFVRFVCRGAVGDAPNAWIYEAVPHDDISDTLGEIEEAGGILL
jgi:hypothetical protein